MIDLSVIIVTWRARELVFDCLASLDREVRQSPREDRLDVEVFLVDNASGDDTAGAVSERFPWVHILSLPRPSGFAAANNAALAKASGRHVLLLNNDTVVLPGALERCVRFLDAHPDVGAVGPQLLNPDGSRQNSVHNYPSLLSEVVPRGLLETLAPSRFPSKRRRHTEPIDVEAVLGACLFARREVLDRVGPMPEDFFFFLEETDWCWAIRAAGWRIVHVPDAEVIHVHGATTKKRIPARTRIEYQISLHRFFRKRRGALQAGLVRSLCVAKSILYAVVLAPGAVFSERQRERWQSRCAVLAWYLRGCPPGSGLAPARAGEGMA